VGNDSEDSEVNFKELKAQGVAWYKKVSQERFKRLPSGYVWDKWIGKGILFLILAFALFVAHSYNYDLNYYKCGNDMPDYIMQGPAQLCQNPFYKPSITWRSQEYLPPGEYGQKPGALIYSAVYMPIILFGVAIILNHNIHNRRKK